MPLDSISLQNKRLKILVLGATGFVGNHLINSLRLLDFDVYATYRTQSKKAIIDEQGIKSIYADITLPKTLTSAFDGKDCIINLTTVINEEEDDQFKSVLFNGIENIIHAMIETKVGRIVQIGALADEGSSNNLKNVYLYWKKKGCQLLVDLNVPHVTLETSFIYGPGDQHLSAIGWFLKFFPFFPSSGKAIDETQFQPIYIDDLISCILKSIVGDQHLFKTYHLGGIDKMKHIDMVKIIANYLGKRKLVIRFPEFMVRTTIRVLNVFLKNNPVPNTFLNYKGLKSIVNSDYNILSFGIEPKRFGCNLDYLNEIKSGFWKTWFK